MRKISPPIGKKEDSDCAVYESGFYHWLDTVKKTCRIGTYRSLDGFVDVHLYHDERRYSGDEHYTDNGWVIYLQVIHNGRTYERRIRKRRCPSDRSLSVNAGKFIRHVVDTH